MAIACGVLVVLSIPAAVPRWQLASNHHPKPPTQAQIKAAGNKIRQQQAALGAQQGKLSAANTQLAALQVQAEVLTQRYDQTLVDEQRAAAAYKVTESRLRYAQQAQQESRLRLARLAASEFRLARLAATKSCWRATAAWMASLRWVAALRSACSAFSRSWACLRNALATTSLA